MVRIAHITDLHIASKDENAGVDVRKNFLSIIESIREHINEIDHIVITGDLCFTEGSAEVYTWIRKQIESLQVSFSVIPGNHDNILMMKELFNMPQSYLKEDGLYYKKDIGFGEANFMDTSQHKVTEYQLEWLDHQLAESNKPKLLFMHHPPVKAGITYMDRNHALQNIDDLNEILVKNEEHVQVFCGHYHTEKELTEGNISVYITPSNYCQIDQVKDEFTIDHYRFGWRMITWRKNKIATSEVKYLMN